MADKQNKSTKKTKEVKPEKKDGFWAGFKAKAGVIVKTDGFWYGSVVFLTVLFLGCLLLGLTLGLRSCYIGDPFDPAGDYFVNAYAATTKVGYSYEVTDTVERYKPVEGVHDERDAFPIAMNLSKRYPTYGSTLNQVIGTDNDKVEARNALINESAYLCAWGTAGANRGGEETPDKYTWMDKDGWLYRGEVSAPVKAMVKTATGYGEQQRQLYKHTASVGLYLGDVADNEPGIIKKVTLRNRGYGSYSVTGVYAPAGEVIKIQLSGADMNATGGITVHIGQALYNGQANNIWAGKNQMQRMPHVLTTLEINEKTAVYDEQTDTWTGYVGSFLGGPLYIRNNSATFTATISGGVAYRHFVLGYTSPEEYAELCKSTAPYFDLEVWEYGVLHSGPVRYARSFSYDQLYDAAVLWEKVSTVTTTNGTKQGIVFIYDPFVAAGAAVAFPGRSSVNCPLGWMSQSLNYSSIVTSGSWGNFHEYHHNFQNYGVTSDANGEVTNNGLNLVSYSLFTNISSARQISGYGGAGLSGWNQYTSATWALNRVNTGAITSTNGLAIYATLLHNFGQDQYIKARGATNTNSYLDKWATNTHQDFTYYASRITAYGSGTYSPSQAVKNANYPLFVPVSSVYQTGRTYSYDGEKREINTMQPYLIPYGRSFTVDLRPYENLKNSDGSDSGQYSQGSVVIGNGFKYNIKGFDASKANGTFEESGDGIYTFTPNNELRSGKIYVTLEITTEDGKHEWNGHKLDDVDLVLEFQQSHEWNKSVLERTIYTYAPENMYTDAQTAFENNFAGYESKSDIDHSNPTQNANTDIWYWPSTSGHEAYVETHPEYFATNNAIHVIDGKLYFKEDGKYRVYLRGRYSCALYYSLNGKDYTLGAKINDTNDSAAFRLNDPNTYLDVQFTEGVCAVWVYVGGDKTYEYTVKGDYWLYTKEILIAQTSIPSSSKASYIGLGSAQWTVPQYSTEVKYYIGSGASKQYVEQEIDNDETRYYYTDGSKKVYVDDNSSVSIETHYYTVKDGKKVEVSAEEASNVDPIPPTSASYANAYRRSYEFKKEFESDYFYTRSYSYDYKDNISVPKNEVTVTQTNYTATGWGSGMPITNISDGKTDTYIHTSWQVTANKPLELTFDLGGEKTINRITFYCRNNNGMLETPKAFTVEGSLNGETWFDVAAYTDAPRNGHYVTVDFDVTAMRYCRIKISQTHQGDGSYYVVIGEITFTHSTEILGGNQYSPDNGMFSYTGRWQVASASSNFGHVYVGKEGAEIAFEFEGKRLAVISSKQFRRNFEVYIDGNLVESISFNEEIGDFTASYISPELENGKHSVVIKCTGQANFDSFAIY